MFNSNLKIGLISLLLLTGLISNAQPAGYYNGTEGKKGEEFKTVLNQIISNHVDFSYSFSRNIMDYTDQDPENPDNVILFYLQESRNADNYGSGGDNINREHVWAKSHGNFANIRPMDSDVHNLHPADASVNEDRSNKDFDNIQPLGSQHPEALYCYYTDSTWEPGPKTKGQVARTLFYMATRYEGNNEEMDLEVVNHNHTYPNPLHGNLNALLQWNRDYPPTDFEKRRNERVFRAQRNRNPFVDHPEFANLIWADATPSNIQFSNFEMTPEFPVLGEEITISISIDGQESTDEVTLFGGNEFNPEDEQSTMQANGSSYTATITPAEFTAGDMLYFTVRINTPDSIYSWPASYRYPETIEAGSLQSIPDIQGDGDASPMTGQEVTLSGRVTANFDYSFYMETNDEAFSGINVYNTIFRGKVGDSLIVRGTIEEYNNLTELGNVSYVYNYQDKQQMTPKVITTADFGEKYEGMLVSVHQVSFEKGGQEIPEENTSYTFTDQTGSAVMFVANNSRLVNETLPSGYSNVTGILSQYQGTYQLLPRTKNDFYLLTDSPDLKNQTNVVTIYPNPTNDILYIKTPAKVKEARIYNLGGQLLKCKTSQPEKINTSDLLPGLYLLEVVADDNQISREKFVKASN